MYDLDDAVERIRSTKERQVVDGESWTCDLLVSRDGDDETGFDVALFPGPRLKSNPEYTAPGSRALDTRRMALSMAILAVPGLAADRVIFTSDAYAIRGHRAEARRGKRRLERDFKNSMHAAVMAGAADELGITDAMVAVLAERPSSPDRLGRVSQRYMPYKVHGPEVQWLEDTEGWSVLVDDGLAATAAVGGFVIDVLRDTFRRPDLLQAGKEVYKFIEKDPDDDFDPESEPELARCFTDIVALRLLAEMGAMVVPLLPPGPRADFIEEHLKQYVEENPDAEMGYLPADPTKRR